MIPPAERDERIARERERDREKVEVGGRKGRKEKRGEKREGKEGKGGICHSRNRSARTCTPPPCCVMRRGAAIPLCTNSGSVRGAQKKRESPKTFGGQDLNGVVRNHATDKRPNVGEEKKGRKNEKIKFSPKIERIPFQPSLLPQALTKKHNVRPPFRPRGLRHHLPRDP